MSNSGRKRHRHPSFTVGAAPAGPPDGGCRAAQWRQRLRIRDEAPQAGEERVGERGERERKEGGGGRAGTRHRKPWLRWMQQSHLRKQPTVTGWIERGPHSIGGEGESVQEHPCPSHTAYLEAVGGLRGAREAEPEQIVGALLAALQQAEEEGVPERLRRMPSPASGAAAGVALCFL